MKKYVILVILALLCVGASAPVSAQADTVNNSTSNSQNISEVIENQHKEIQSKGRAKEDVDTVHAQFGDVQILDTEFDRGDQTFTVEIQNTGDESVNVVLQDQFQSGDYIYPQIIEVGAGERMRVEVTAETYIREQKVMVYADTGGIPIPAQFENPFIGTLLPQDPDAGHLAIGGITSALGAGLMFPLITYIKVYSRKEEYNALGNEDKTYRPSKWKIAQRRDPDREESVSQTRARNYVPDVSTGKLWHGVLLDIYEYGLKAVPYIMMLSAGYLIVVAVGFAPLPAFDITLSPLQKMLTILFSMGVIIGKPISTRVVEKFIDVPKENILAIDITRENKIKGFQGHKELIADAQWDNGKPVPVQFAGRIWYLCLDFDPKKNAGECNFLSEDSGGDEGAMTHITVLEMLRNRGDRLLEKGELVDKVGPEVFHKMEGGYNSSMAKIEMDGTLVSPDDAKDEMEKVFDQMIGDVDESDTANLEDIDDIDDYVDSLDDGSSDE